MSDWVHCTEYSLCLDKLSGFGTFDKLSETRLVELEFFLLLDMFGKHFGNRHLCSIEHMRIDINSLENGFAFLASI